MTGFQHTPDGLACDGVPLDRIADEAGTPVHVYSAAVIRERYHALAAAFAGVPHRCHYALKANATLAVVRLLRDLGAGADVNSGGELDVALRAGFTPPDIVFTGVGKTRAELDRAAALGLRAVNAESSGEVARLDAAARAAGRDVRVAIRINPGVDAESHPHLTTGLAATKFGMSADAARALVRDVRSRERLRVVGLHVHIGSQIRRAAPFARAAAALAALAREFLADGVTLEHLDVGGGLAVAYHPEDAVIDAAAYAAALAPAAAAAGLPLLLEPGRWIVAPAGVLVTEVVDRKPGPDREFVIADAGMTDLVRPALYGAWHRIEAVRPRAGAPVRCDVVGPVCETSDTLGGDRGLPPVEVGDRLAVRDTGAYGAVMASNYNRRPTAAEVLVDDGGWRIVRRRQSSDDLFQWDEPC